MSPLLLVALLQASETQAPLERFEHGRHERALAKAGLSCQDCHGLGTRPPEGVHPDEVSLMPPGEVCHSCHRSEQRQRPRPPSRCATCHPTVTAPTGHGAGWLELHGSEARLGMQACEDCHRDSECVACHEDRESIRFDVHDRSWLSVHGVAARANPAECTTCHSQSSCLACHSSGVQPW